MKKTVLFLVIIFIINLFAMSQSEREGKKIKFLKTYTYQICKNQSLNRNCLGYGKPKVGSSAKISGILIQNDSAIIIDSYLRCLLKINLLNGSIIKKSNVFSSENSFDGLSELIYFNNEILLLSASSSNLYIVDSDLNPKKNITIPNHGSIADFYMKNNHLFIKRDCNEFYFISDDSLNALTYKVDSNYNLNETWLSFRAKEYREDTLVYGSAVHVIDDDGKCYLKTQQEKYEIPEKIPELDDFMISLGYNEKFVVYFVFHETYYTMVVYEYW